MIFVPNPLNRTPLEVESTFALNRPARGKCGSVWGVPGTMWTEIHNEISNVLEEKFGVQRGTTTEDPIMTWDEQKLLLGIMAVQVVGFGVLASIAQAGMCHHRNRRFSLAFMTSLFSGSVAVFFGVITFGCAVEGRWWAGPTAGSSAFELVTQFNNNFLLTNTPMTRFVSLWFFSHCVVDMGLALFFYREEMKVDTGWVHHTIYAIMQIYVLYVGWGTTFSLHMVSELPTLLLAIGVVHEPLRWDDAFGLTFGLSRVVMHAGVMMCYLYFQWHAPLAWFLHVLTFVLHLKFMLHWVNHRFGFTEEPAYVFPEPDAHYLAAMALEDLEDKEAKQEAEKAKKEALNMDTATVSASLMRKGAKRTPD